MWQLPIIQASQPEEVRFGSQQWSCRLQRCQSSSTSGRPFGLRTAASFQTSIFDMIREMQVRPALKTCVHPRVGGILASRSYRDTKRSLFHNVPGTFFTYMPPLSLIYTCVGFHSLVDSSTDGHVGIAESGQTAPGVFRQNLRRGFQ